MPAAGQITANARLKRRTALASVAASVLMTLVKFAAGMTAGSLALLSEAAHNGLDVAASGLTYYAVREADKPADEDHHFGHAKIEAVVALFQTGFLFVLAAAVAFAALRRIGGEAETVDANVFAFGAIAISIVIDIVRWRGLTIVAARTGSDALAAAALHFSSDLIASILVLVGLAATRAGLPNVEVTLTANPVALDDETVLERILLIASRRRLVIHRLGVQNVGGRKSVTLDLEVEGGMRLDDADEIASQREAAIAADIGAEIEVETHIEPMEIHELGGEPAEPGLVEQMTAELSQAVARGDGLSEIHDVRVRVGPAGFYVIFHCRADPNLTVAATHDEVDALERALRNRFADVIRIVGHAEPAR